MRDENGRPFVKTCGDVARKLQTLGINNIAISISHTARYATAFAVGYSTMEG